MTSTYSISFTYTEGGGGTFNGIFTVDGSGTILSFYDIRDLSTNILLNTACDQPADNFYRPNDVFKLSGYIQNTINNLSDIIYLEISPSETGEEIQFYLYTVCGQLSSVNSTQFIITPYVPPNRFSLKQICCSIYSDNARVFYKPHSLPSCGVGTVKNSRHTARKT